MKILSATFKHSTRIPVVLSYSIIKSVPSSRPPWVSGKDQGYLLSPVLFNLFLERIMQDTLQNNHTSISIGGRPICNLRFADDIDLMGSSNSELQDLTDNLINSSKAYGMEVSSEKSKVMVKSTRPNLTSNILMNGELLEEVGSFKYLGATLTKDGSSSKEIRIRIASATAAFTRLMKIWKSNISFPIKFNFYKSLVTSILLYGCESWTMLADSEKKIQSFEMKCMRKLLNISYRDHKTNDFVRMKINNLVGPQEPLLATVKRRKLVWFGHVTRHDSISKTIMQGTVRGSRRQGRQRKSWLDNIKEWSGLTVQELLSLAGNRTSWRAQTAAFSALRSP